MRTQPNNTTAKILATASSVRSEVTDLELHRAAYQLRREIEVSDFDRREQELAQMPERERRELNARCSEWFNG